MKIKIDESLCPKNHKCPALIVCPVKAITQEGFNAPVIDKKLCIKCGRCIRYCPKGVFVLEK